MSETWSAVSGAILVAVPIIIALRSARTELRTARLQVYGLPHNASKLLRGIVVGLILVCGGITLIDEIRRDVPLWASILLPAAALYFTIPIMLDQLAWRPTFTLPRFGKVVVAPVLASITPVSAVLLRHLSEVFALI